jgi:DNA-binding response OmpR family regulator
MQNIDFQLSTTSETSNKPSGETSNSVGSPGGRILIVDDEMEMAELLAQALTEEGFLCNIANNGLSALRQAAEFDLLLVDVMMPVMNGFELVEQLRSQGRLTPVIYLSAKDTIQDKVKGLNLGADDYLGKPFVLDELIARVKAALRRARDTSQLLYWRDVTLDRMNRTAHRGSHELFLSAKEFALLEFFVQRPEIILSKSLILEQVWKDPGFRDSNIIETYVNYLRRKTEQRDLCRIIHTVRGKGYILALAEVQP